MTDGEAHATISQEELKKEFVANEIFIKVENEIEEPEEFVDESERNVDGSASDDEALNLKRNETEKQEKPESTRKTAAERSKAYREQLKLCKSSLQANPNTVNPLRKTNAERCVAYRERLKLREASSKDKPDNLDSDAPLLKARLESSGPAVASPDAAAVKPQPRTASDRAKAYRARMKLLKLKSTDPTAATAVEAPRMTGAERMKEYRRRIKLCKQVIASTTNDVQPPRNDVRTPRKTAAERSKAYRERMKLCRTNVDSSSEPTSTSDGKAPRLTAAEKMKAYRQRMKLCKLSLESPRMMPDESIEQWQERIKCKLADSNASRPGRATPTTSTARVRLFRDRKRLRELGLIPSDSCAVSPTVVKELIAAIDAQAQSRGGKRPYRKRQKVDPARDSSDPMRKKTKAERVKAYKDKIKLLKSAKLVTKTELEPSTLD